MPEIPALITKTSPADLRDLLIGGHISAVGEPPNYARLGVAWAQLMLECGRGERVWNFNFGNMKCNAACQAKPSSLFVRVPATGREYPIQRAYVGPVEGCAAYWRLIGSLYPQALPLFDAGEPYDAMQALYNGGNYPSYFEAPPDAYGKTVSALFQEYVATFPKHQYDPGGPGPTEPPTGWPTIAILGALGVALGAALYFST